MIKANTSLWKLNTPSQFWNCQVNPAPERWSEAIARSVHLLDLMEASNEIEQILALTLGEQRFGPEHWNLGTVKKIYYLLKPVLPRALTRQLRQYYNQSSDHDSQIPWPVDARYVNFLWEVIRQIMILEGKDSLRIRNLWPGRNDFALILTHDIETADGQAFAEEVATLEESLGFRSSFNFVPERYQVDFHLMEALRERGFEVGVHGLKHDGKLFASEAIFKRRALRINQYLKDWQATGFRADLTIREPEGLQMLNAQYDLSFFDTDPYEPIPGGTMSIWPFFLGRFVELPYTLVQDYTLTSILKERTPRIWLDKVNFIEKYHGMALLNSHPDYLRQKFTWNVYYDFLTAMKKYACYWHALPHDVAEWWQERADINLADSRGNMTLLRLTEKGLEFESSTL